MIEHGYKKYAQYEKAPFVTFIPKGKRNPCQIIKGYNPYILILNGWDNPEPEGMWGKAEIKDKVTITATKYTCFDQRYRTDFNLVVDLHKEKFLADYRELVEVKEN